MDPSHLIIYIITLATAIICLTIITYALKHRSTPGAVSLVFIMAAILGYAIPYTLQFTSHNLDITLLFYYISILGANLIGPSWLIFSLNWANLQLDFSKGRYMWIMIGVFIIPLIVCLAGWSNPLHHWYGTNFRLITQGDLPILEWDFGFFNWVGYIYSYVLTAVGMVILVVKAIQRLRLLFHQTLLILIGAFIPIICNLAFVNGFLTIGKIDITPFSFLVTGVLWSIAIFRFRFLKIVPIAHQNVFKYMPIGMIVIDNQSIVLDINPTVSDILNIPVDVIGRTLPENIINQIFNDPNGDYAHEKNELITLEQDGGKKSLDIHFSPLYDPKNIHVGTLLLINDITSRVSSEEALKQSESRLILAQTVARVGNWELDLTTRSLWASAEAFRIYGLDRSSEFLPLDTVQKIATAKDRPILDAALAGLIQNNEPYSLDYQIVRQDDRLIRIIHTEASLMKDENGKPFKVIGIIQDITERKQAEIELQESQVLYKALIESQIDPVCRWLPDTTLTYVNKSYCEYFGKPEEQLLGSRFKTWLPEETQEIVVNMIDRLMRKAISSINNEEFNFDAQGNQRWMIWNYRPITNKDGEIVEFQSVGRDITQRKNTENALYKSEERFKQLAEVFPETIFESDLTGNLTYTNHYGHQCFGITEADIARGVNIMNLIVPEDRQKVQQRIQERFTGKTGEFLEYKALRKNGESFDALAYASLIRNNGKIEGLRGFILDISGRKRIEQALSDSESNFRTFFETIDDIILVATLEGKILFGNKALERKLGYTPDDLSTMHVLDLNPEDKREEAEAIFASMFRGERTSCPLPLVTKENVPIPAETRVWFGKWNGVNSVFSISKDLRNELEAQQRFESLFRNNPTLMALSSIPERRFTDVNNAFLSTLGYTPEEILGKTSAELNLFINSQQQESMARQLQATGRLSEMELQVRCKDGKILNGLFSGEMISSRGKEHFLTVMIDITERKRFESALQESELYFRSLFEQAAVGVAVVDSKSGTFLQINQRFCEILGYSREEMEGVAFKNITHPDDVEISLEKMKDMMSGKINKFSMEKRYISKTGNSVWVTLSVAAMWLPGAEPTSFITIIQDITDQKAAETALRESDSRMRAIAESAQDAILMIDPRGNISYWNPAAESILGYTNSEAIGKNLHKLIVPQRFHQAHDAAFPIFTKTGQGDALGKSHEMYAIRKDGSEIPVRLSLSAFQINNGWYATGMISDISERKRTEKIQQVTYKIAQAIVSDSGIEEQYPLIHTILNDLLPAQNFYIALYNPEKNVISYPYLVDQYDEPPAPKKPGHGLTEYVIRTGQSILVTPEIFDELVQKGEVEPIGSDSVDWMGSPLVVEGRIIGVMVMQSYSEKVRFNLEDVKLLEFVSNQVALAIDRKNALELQEHNSTHDGLTGLFNRQYYEIEIERLQNSRQFPVSIFMMDLDGLKRVNDVYGHSAGDELLRRATRILKSAFRPEDMIARVGGDEFVAVLPETDPKSAAQVLKRLKNSFKKHNKGVSSEHCVNISIGIATGDKSSQLTDIFKKADQAMYKAKAIKKNSMEE